MERKMMFYIIVIALIASSLGCGFSLDLGQARSTPTSTSIPPTIVIANTPTQIVSPTNVAETPIPTQAVSTTQPTPTPPPPPEVISSKNYDRLTFNRAFGIGALIKVQVSPDGKTALLAYSTRLVLLDINNLTPIWQIDPGTFLYDITFSQDGKQIISLSIGGSVKIWDAASGALLASPIKQREGLSYIALSPGGNWFAFTDYTGITKVLYAASGELKTTNNGQAYPGGISGLLLSPDEETLIMEGVDSVLKNQVQQWKVTDGKFKIGLLTLPPQMVSWKYSSDGKRLYGINPRSLTAQPSTELLAWNTTNGKLEKAFPKNDLIFDYLPSPDGKTVLIATKDGLLKLIDAESGTTLGSFSGHSTSIDGMAFTPDGQAVISASVDGKIILWDTFTKKALQEVAGTPGMPYAAPALSSIADRALILSPDRTNLGILNTVTWQPEQKLAAGEFSYSALAISSQANFAAALDENNHIHVWNSSSGQEIKLIEPLTRFPIKKLKFSPDEKYISSLSEGQVLTWDITTGKKLKDMAGFNDFDYSPDNTLIAADSADFNLYLTELQTGKMKAVIPAEYISSITYSPDGRLIAVGAQKIQPKERGLLNLIYQVDSQTKKRIPLELSKIPALVSNMAFSPGGDMLASSDVQGNVILWNLRDGKPLINFEEIVSPPATLKFSADGTLLYVGGGEGALGIIATSPLGSSSQVPAPKVTPASDLSIPSLSPTPYAHSKGLLTISLPAGWKVAEKDCSINVANPNNKGGIAFSAINTVSPLTGEMFTTLVTGYEKDFSQSAASYTEIDKSIDIEKGEAFVTKRVKLDGVDYIWETYYTRDGAMVYQMNFLTPGEMAEAMLPLYKQVYESVKVNKEYVLKQTPYFVTKTIQDPNGNYSFEVPLGWNVTIETKADSQPTVTTTIITSPDNFFSITSFRIEGEKTWDEKMVKTLFDSFPNSLAKDIKITELKKTTGGDSRIDFESSNILKGTGLSSNFGTKVHMLYIVYRPDLEKAYLPLIEYILNSYQKK